MKYENIDNTKSIPLNSIRRIMERHCPYHISMEAIILLRDMIEEIAANITIDVVKNFEEMNEFRKIQGLRKLKRLNAWAVKNSNYNKTIINALKNKNKGLQSQGVVTPGGGKMPACINTAKPDKTTNDQREVV